MSDNTSLNLVENGINASSKGLYIIFFVGLAQVVLDVQLIKFQLSIPWLMDVKLGNPGNLYILYCLISLFAVWKFYLANTTELTELMSLSLSKFFNSRLGQVFIQKYIFGPEEFSTSKHSFNSKQNLWETKVLGYSEGEDCTESMGFLWADSGHLRIHYGWDENFGKSERIAWTKYKDKWGLTKLPVWEEPGLQEHFRTEISNISDTYFNSILVFFTSVYSMLVSLTTYKGINVTLPILCNLLLVNFIAYSRLFKIISTS